MEGIHLHVARSNMHGFTVDDDLSQGEPDVHGQQQPQPKVNVVDLTVKTDKERDVKVDNPWTRAKCARKRCVDNVVDLCVPTQPKRCDTTSDRTTLDAKPNAKEAKIHPMFWKRKRDVPKHDTKRTRSANETERNDKGTKTNPLEKHTESQPKVVNVDGSEDEASNNTCPRDERHERIGARTEEHDTKQDEEAHMRTSAKRIRIQTSGKPIHVQDIQLEDLPAPTKLHLPWFKDNEEGVVKNAESLYIPGKARLVNIPDNRVRTEPNTPTPSRRTVQLDPEARKKEDQHFLDVLVQWIDHRNGNLMLRQGEEARMEGRWRRQLEWHGNHTRTELNWRAGHGGELQWISSGPQPLWTEKHRPNSIEQLCSNSTAKRMLAKWLAEWKNNPHRASESVQLLQKRKEAVREWGLASKNDLLKELGLQPGQLEEEECWLSSGFLLVGPCASGKTSLVYACAKEMGFKVKEVSASDKRTGKDLTNLIGEATQSKRLDYTQYKAVGKHSLDCRAEDAGEESGPAPASSDHATLILVEDVDLVFEEDRGFASALSGLIKAAKRPIVLTCSSNERPWVMNEVCLASTETRLPTHEELVPLLACIAHAEGLEMSCKPKYLQELVRICGRDPRRAILELQSLGGVGLAAWKRGRVQQTFVDSVGSEATQAIVNFFGKLPSRIAHAPCMSGTSAAMHRRICKAVFAACMDAEETKTQALSTRVSKAKALKKEKLELAKWDLGTINRARKGQLINFVKKMQATCKTVKKNELPLVRSSRHEECFPLHDGDSPQSMETGGLDGEEQEAIHIARRAIARAIASDEDDSLVAETLSSQETNESPCQEQLTNPLTAAQSTLNRLQSGGCLPKYRPPAWEMDLMNWAVEMAEHLSVADTLCVPSYQQTIHGPSENQGSGNVDGVEDPMLCSLGELGDLQGLDAMVSSRAAEAVASLATESCTRKLDTLIHLESRAVPELSTHGDCCSQEDGFLGHIDPSPVAKATLWGLIQDICPSLAVSRSSAVLSDLTSFSARIARAEHARLEKATGRHKKNFMNHLQKGWGLPSKYNNYLVAYSNFHLSEGKVPTPCPG